MKSKTKIGPKQILQIILIYATAALAFTACARGFQAKPGLLKNEGKVEAKNDERTPGEDKTPAASPAPLVLEFKSAERIDMGDGHKQKLELMLVVHLSDGKNMVRLRTIVAPKSPTDSTLETAEDVIIEGRIFRLQTDCATNSCDVFSALVTAVDAATSTKAQAAALFQNQNGEIKALKLRSPSTFTSATQVLNELGHEAGVVDPVTGS